MKPKVHPVIVALVVIFLAFFLNAPLSLLAEEPASTAQDEKEGRLSVEELMKSKAGELFVNRRFEEALAEFRKLAAEYPRDIVIRRYIGACLDNMRRDEEAIAAFQEALSLNPADLVSRQFMAKIYLRMGRLDQAEEHYTYILNNDERGTFTAGARAQLDTIKRLRETEKKLVQAPGRKITPQAFLQTDAAQAFMKAKYDEALEELAKLETQYPEDVLIKRYKGLALDRLKRFDEAAAAYNAGLKIVPNNIALHYFLAQTLLHQRDLEGAKREFQYVVDNDESKTYQVRAQQELAAIEKLIELMKRMIPKKWTLSASAGAEVSSNPSSNTRVKALKTAPTNSAWKLSESLGGTYEFYKRGPVSAKLTYTHADSFYTDSLSSLTTLSNIVGANATYVRALRGKPLIAQIGHNTTHTMIREQYYSTSFSQSLTLIYPVKDWYRITLSEKWSFTTYDGDGTNPDSTSRDGFGNLAGITKNFYFNKAKNLSALLGFEYGEDDVQGINYIKDAFTYRTGLHFPLLLKVEGDLSFKLKDSQYPKYGFPTTTPGRRDLEYALGATLSRSLSKNWNLTASYNYSDNNSREDSFTYVNQTLGVNLAYNY